jgi:ABC-type enterochelin transport system permease subunit
MSTRRKIMWIGISLAAVYLVLGFMTLGAPEILGFRIPQIDAYHMGELVGRLTGIIILLGLVWILAFRKTANKNKP